MQTRYLIRRGNDWFSGPSAKPVLGDRAKADLYSEQEAAALLAQIGAMPHEYELVEAGLQDFLAWAGRRGGRSKSPKKAAASRNNAKKGHTP